MKALVVHCHPRPESFTAAVRDVVLARLSAAGAEVRLIDLYARGFDPVLSAGAHEAYEDAGRNRAGSPLPARNTCRVSASPSARLK